jgi:hypothetical protein
MFAKKISVKLRAGRPDKKLGPRPNDFCGSAGPVREKSLVGPSHQAVWPVLRPDLHFIYKKTREKLQNTLKKSVKLNFFCVFLKIRF